MKRSPGVVGACERPKAQRSTGTPAPGESEMLVKRDAVLIADQLNQLGRIMFTISGLAMSGAGRLKLDQLRHGD